MIIIVVDEIEPWFEYIWEQFVQVNSLNTEYIFLAYSDYKLSEYVEKTPFLIEYGIKQRYPNSLFIAKKKEVKTDDYVWINEDLPVYRSTITYNGDGKSYDIFYNAFVHLSRLEEWETERKGKFIHSYSFNHPRKKKRIWNIPVVNYLFNELEKKIQEKYPAITFGSREKPVIELSHDVDYIQKTGQLRIKQSLFHFFNGGKFLLRGNFHQSISKFKSSVDFAYRTSDYWCFDYWTELENKLNIKSTYYFFARTGSQSAFNPKRWLLDPSYDISRNEQLKDKCKELVSNDNSIGIHGSYFSAENESLFCKEKEILEHSINCRITKSRQHWLNYCESDTPYIHSKAGIKEDSTLGFNDIPGFRAGIASRYNPYDHANNRSFTFKEIPLVVMDSHLYDYSTDSDSQNLGWLFDSVNKIKNFMISIGWHQRVISRDYGWDAGLRQFLKIDKGLFDGQHE